MAGSSGHLDLGPADLAETRTRQVLQPGVTLTRITRGGPDQSLFWTLTVLIPSTSTSPDPDAPPQVISDEASAQALAAHLRKLSSVLGLLEQEPDAFLQSGAQADDGEVAEIEALIKARLEARQAKDWAAADAARNRLTEMGIILEDGPQGTTWRRK